MSSSRILAAAFEDEIVLLDADRGVLLHLDAWATQIWRSCDERTTETIAASSGGPERVRETLRVLTDVGLVRPVGDAWRRTPVEWV